MTEGPPPADSAVALRRCGDTAYLLDLPDNGAVHRWAAAVRQAVIPGVVEVIPGLTTLLVQIDAEATNLLALQHALHRVLPVDEGASTRGEHVIAVTYDGEDLDVVCSLTGLDRRGVVAAHTGRAWQVAFCGFAPGFAYLVGGDPRLEVPRRDESRVRVPAGAVALAGPFSSIYPRASPGGWQLIGHTNTELWNLAWEPPALLSPGMTVRFVDIQS